MPNAMRGKIIRYHTIALKIPIFTSVKETEVASPQPTLLNPSQLMRF